MHSEIKSRSPTGTKVGRPVVVEDTETNMLEIVSQSLKKHQRSNDPRKKRRDLRR